MKQLVAAILLAAHLLPTNCRVSADDGGSLDRVVFVVLSQSNYLHARLATEQKGRLRSQLSNDGVRAPRVYDLHTDWTMHGNHF
jgi:hypothetical protein